MSPSAEVLLNVVDMDCVDLPIIRRAKGLDEQIRPFNPNNKEREIEFLVPFSIFPFWNSVGFKANQVAHADVAIEGLFIVLLFLQCMGLGYFATRCFPHGLNGLCDISRIFR